MSILDWNNKMQLHISPSLRHVTVLPGKGLKEFIKVKVASRRLSYRMLFYSLLFFTFLLRFVFVLTAVDGIDGQNKCSTIGTLPLFTLTRTRTRAHTHSLVAFSHNITHSSQLECQNSLMIHILNLVN